MGALKQEFLPHYVYEDYVQWEGSWELLYGVPYAMSPAPIKQHQRISGAIQAQLYNALQDCDACYASLPVDWKIAEDTIVQPDNLVICEDSSGTYITRTPPLIFEVLSKSTASKDGGVKFELYEQEGVKWYIMADPEEKLAKVYENIQGRFVKRLDATEETFTFTINRCDIAFDFAKLWQ